MGAQAAVKLLLVGALILAPNAAASQRLDYFLQAHPEISQVSLINFS